MDFKTQAQQRCYEKVKGLATEIFGERAMWPADRPTFLVSEGSTYAAATVFNWGDDDAVVNTRAYVILGPRKTPELMDYLLHLNNEMRFGAFGLDGDDDVFFEHAIVGSTIDKGELRASVMAVLFTADKYDDELRQRFGGRRALDQK